MPVLVQKYGGSSVANAERIRHVAQRVVGLAEQGEQTVVVVSAMGDTTDHLLAVAREIAPDPDERELDLLLSTGETVSMTLLAMALRTLGHPAISLTGAQAGIRTDSRHRKAVITAVHPGRIRRELDRGRIVIVAGFQGISEEADVTTLGRGGSDVTAVALAVSLGAERCEIYTDVEGVYTADPRLEPQAQILPEIGYEEMLELATYGARVMHPRAVELGWVYNLPILVASTFKAGPGTLIHGGAAMEAVNKVRGIAHDNDVARITILGVPDRPGIAAALFEPLAEAGISVDTIVQNSGVNRVADLSFTVTRDDCPRALRIVDLLARTLGSPEVLSDDALAKVSIVGAGMQSAPGYAARMFRTLYEAGINIEMITTSEIRITCIIALDQVQEAVRALHGAFALERTEEGVT